MLDTRGLDQGAGLRQWATSLSPLIISMVHHGDKAAEMSALWQICARLQRLGYPLSVLDVTAAEGQNDPGLQDMLTHSNRPQPATPESWSIIPAAIGIQHLAATLAPAETFEQALSNLFLDFGAVVIYADADTLAGTLNLASSYPVVPVSPDTRSLLSAYASLKKLSLHGHAQQAALVTVRPDDSPRQISQRIAKSLQNCTIRHLRCRLNHFDIGSSLEPENQPDDMRQLVMHLLDRATPSGSATTTQRLWSH